MTPSELFDKCISGPWQTSGDDVQWKTWEQDGKRYIAFEAVGNMKEYAMALKLWPDTWMGWLAHAGYVNHLWSWIEDTYLTSKPTVLCGYSLGGSLAVLLAQYMGNACIEVITFGAPRCYFAGMKSRAKITRYEMRGDPVPHLPFAIFGYKHIGDRVKLGKPSIFNPEKHQYPVYAETLKCLPK